MFALYALMAGTLFYVTGGAALRRIILHAWITTTSFSNQRVGGIVVGTSATNVGRTPTFCVTHVHFHCARDAVKMQLYFVLEEAKVFVSPA